MVGSGFGLMQGEAESHFSTCRKLALNLDSPCSTLLVCYPTGSDPDWVGWGGAALGLQGAPRQRILLSSEERSSIQGQVSLGQGVELWELKLCF